MRKKADKKKPVLIPSVLILLVTVVIVTVMKTHFQKEEPKIIQFRDYNNFTARDYCKYIVSILSSRYLTRSDFDTFITK